MSPLLESMRAGFEALPAALVDAQVAEITSTVAARSGLTASAWAANVATMKTWMTTRADAMDAQFTTPPVLSHPGGDVPVGFSLTMAAAAGTIYYTTDGADPRMSGGAVNPAAAVYSGAVSLSGSAVVKARAFSGGNWSALNEALFLLPAQPLRIVEVNYAPVDPPTKK